MGLDCECQSRRNQKKELAKNLPKVWWRELKFI